MRAPLLRVAALHMRFGARVLFDGAGFDLQAGHGYVLSGANGSGKTTLLRIIAGLESAQQGYVVLSPSSGARIAHSGAVAA